MGALTVVGLALALSLFIVRSAEGTGTCGERQLTATALIANGYNARVIEWPWHGAMYHRYNPGLINYACGVTILTEQFVLTAAHCTYEKLEKLSPRRVFIKVGISNLNAPEDHMRQIDVDKIIRHKKYDKDTFENDIALLMLSIKITYTSDIQPVCLWQNDTQMSKIISKIGYVVGWVLDETNSFPIKLSETTMPIVSSTECKKRNNWHYYKFYFKSKTFCAGRLNDTHVSYGDSGGGLYLQMGSTWVLRGIVSNAKLKTGTLNIQADSYSIFTDVAYYLNWIKAKVPDLPYLAVDTEQTTEIEFEGESNLLDLRNCGKYTHPPGTQEEGKELVNQYTWEAVIRIELVPFSLQIQCIGILIHPNYLITTTQCMNMLEIQKRQIFAWFRVLGYFDDLSTRIRIKRTFRYPFARRLNTLVISELERPATVNPICLPLSDPLELPDATQLHTIGYNDYDSTRYFRNVTQLADLELCKKQNIDNLRNLWNLIESFVCSTVENKEFFFYLAQWQPVENKFFEGQYFLAAFSAYDYISFDGSGNKTKIFINVGDKSDWIRETVKQIS